MSTGVTQNADMTLPDAQSGSLGRAAPGATTAPTARRIDGDDARIQHIALARVLLADPEDVVLDEATVHGDTGGTLDTAVHAAAHGRTAIIVAHRFAQAEIVDRIVVLERGRSGHRAPERRHVRSRTRHAR